MEELVYSTWANSTGTVLGLSALTALWSASRGVFGLLRGLNAVYDVWEDRGWLYTRSISVVYTFLFGLVLLLTLVLHVFGNTILGWLTMVDNGVVIFLMDLIDLRFFLLLILQSLIFTLMFMVLPNQRNRFVDSLPENEQILFISRYWFLAPVAEIAAKRGCTQGKVKVTLFRLREKLKLYLQEENLC